jgi:Na+-transporting NADH:ubiquinone oxidoreductase subunit NqrB
MWNWLNNTDTGRAVRSYVVSFVTVILGLFIADGADIFAVSSTDLKAWLAAGLAAVLPVIITALNPNDPRYGIKNNA